MILTVVLAFLVQILFPIGLAWWFARRFKASWKLMGVGVLTFIGSQVLHIPFLQWLTSAFQQGLLPGPAPEWSNLFNAVVLGLLAGLFEETFRAISYALLRRARAWKDGMALGIGHGGIESILIGLSTLSSFVVFVILRNNPQALNLPQMDLLLQQADSFWAMPWHLPLAGALERLCAIALHLSLSVLVLQAFTRRNALWFFGAILWHAFVDGVLVYLLGIGWGVWPIEALLVVFALISLWIVLSLRDPEPPVAVVEVVEAAV